MNIRPEQPSDYREVENLVRESFWNVYRPGALEHYVLHRLRDLLKKHNLTGAEAPGDIEWNFTKFLIDRDGNVVKRFHPTTTPEEIDAEIAKLL